jgi:DNA-binding CsgD family transcriptional regulator
MVARTPQLGFFDPGLLAILEKAFGTARPPPEARRHLRESSGQVTLTPRERLVLAEIVMGLSSKEVGRSLDISPRTVEFHRANLLRKYGAKNTAELLRKVLG